MDSENSARSGYVELGGELNWFVAELAGCATRLYCAAPAVLLLFKKRWSALP
jgi:hypothetical protein